MSKRDIFIKKLEDFKNKLEDYFRISKKLEIEALMMCIEKYELKCEGIPLASSWSSCALCYLELHRIGTRNNYAPCSMCLISIDTGSPSCEGTPWINSDNQGMLQYLKDLLEKVE